MTGKNLRVFIRYNGRCPVKNFRLAEARVSRGLSSKEAAELFGLNPSTYRAIENLRIYPGEDLRRKISWFFEEGTDDLFPERLRDYVLYKHMEGKRHNDDVYGNLQKAPFDFNSLISGFNKSLDSELLEYAFSILTEKQAEVIKARYGFVDGSEHTLEDIGGRMGLTRQRVWKIESEALEKLRQELNK